MKPYPNLDGRVERRFNKVSIRRLLMDVKLLCAYTFRNLSIGVRNGSFYEIHLVKV